MRLKNYLLSNEEYFKLFQTSPQINYIEYKPFEDKFYMGTDDNYHFEFKVYKKEKKN